MPIIDKGLISRLCPYLTPNGTQKVARVKGPRKRKTKEQETNRNGQWQNKSSFGLCVWAKIKILNNFVPYLGKNCLSLRKSFLNTIRPISRHSNQKSDLRLKTVFL